MERRQRPIPVTGRERESLEEQKKRYEEQTGDTGDWGKFLGTITLLGLAAAGIYGLAKASTRSQQSVDVQCNQCGETFIMAVSDRSDRAVHTVCPYCGTELVVYLE